MASAAPVISKRHVFGINAGVTSNIAYVDNQIAIYTAGHNIIIHNQENEVQRFIDGSIGSSLEENPRIVAMTISPNKRYVAISEKGNRATVTIFDTQTLRKRKILTTALELKEFVSLSFSADSRFLITQGGPPDFCLVLWSWEKVKADATLRFGNTVDNINTCQYCKRDSTLIAICGDKFLAIVRQSSANELRQLPIEWEQYVANDQLWKCLTWVDNVLLLGNTRGEIVSIKDQTFDETVLSIPSQQIHSLCAVNSYTLAVGFEDASILLMRRNPEQPDSQWVRATTVYLSERKSVVRNMAADPSSEHLMCLLTNQQIYTVDIREKSTDDDLAVTQPFGGFHSGEVTGLDTCIRKPLIVTCGIDRSVRVWNYVDKALELMKYFQEEAYSIAFHPSGNKVVVGFADKLKLMNILMDDIRAYKEFHIIRACRECQFSNGGQFFAAVSGDKIHIYNTYSGEMLAILRGHNQRVRSLYWNIDDSGIVSAGSEGAVYEWDLKTGQRPQEYVNRQCPLNTALCTVDGKIYAAGTSGTLKEIQDCQLEKEPKMGCEVSQLVISHVPERMMFAGMTTGIIRSLKFPLTGDQHDYVVHDSKITRLRITFDDSYIFSAGEDGTITVFEIREKEGRLAKRAKPDQVNWGEETLVTTSDLEDKKQLEIELKNKVDELQLHSEYQIRLREMHYQDTLKEKTDKFNKELHNHKQKYEILRDEKQDMEMEYEERVKIHEDKHAEAVQSAEAAHQSRLMAEVEKYHNLERQLKDEEQAWEESTLARQEKHQEVLEEKNDGYEKMLQQNVKTREAADRAKKNIMKEYNETKRQMEEDLDIEIEELKQKYESILSEEREATLRLKGENGVMKKKFAALKNEIEDQVEESRKMQAQEAVLKKTIEKLNTEIQQHDRKMLERDEIIGEKEKKIFDMKKRNQSLEKHKFVLDYRIKELKRQIEPRQNKIAEMRASVQRYDTQLEGYHKENGQLKATIKQLEKNITQVYKKITRHREHRRVLDREISQFWYDIENVLKHIQDPKKLQESVLKLIETHRVKSEDPDSALEPAVIEEYNRQRKLLCHRIESLKSRLASQEKRSSQAKAELMNVNRKLMNHENI